MRPVKGCCSTGASCCGQALLRSAGSQMLRVPRSGLKCQKSGRDALLAGESNGRDASMAGCSVNAHALEGDVQFSELSNVLTQLCSVRDRRKYFVLQTQASTATCERYAHLVQNQHRTRKGL